MAHYLCIIHGLYEPRNISTSLNNITNTLYFYPTSEFNVIHCVKYFAICKNKLLTWTPSLPFNIISENFPMTYTMRNMFLFLGFLFVFLLLSLLLVWLWMAALFLLSFTIFVIWVWYVARRPRAWLGASFLLFLWLVFGGGSNWSCFIVWFTPL